MNLADAYHAFYMAVLVCLSVLTLFCLFRAIQGPRIADRIVSINMICTLTMTMICILAAMLGEGYLVDVALIYALLGFLAVVVLCAVALASIPGRAMTMLLAGQLLAALAALWVVPGNLRRPPAADRFGLRSRRFALQDSIPEEEERDGDPEQPAPQEIQEDDDHA